MFAKSMQWVPLLVLLLVGSWRPSSNYQIALDFVVCAGAVMMVLALFSTKHRVETHYAVDNKSDVGQQSV